MSQRYRVTLQVPYDVVVHDYWTVGIPWNWDRNADSKPIRISKTHLIEAYLDVSVEIDTAWLTCAYELNGVQVFGYPDGASSRVVDVLSWIREGTNTFTAWLFKKYGYADTFYRSGVFDATLHLVYSEEPPEPPKPEKEWWERLIDYAPWIIGGIAVIVVVPKVIDWIRRA